MFLNGNGGDMSVNGWRTVNFKFSGGIGPELGFEPGGAKILTNTTTGGILTRSVVTSRRQTPGQFTIEGVVMGTSRSQALTRLQTVMNAVRGDGRSGVVTLSVPPWMPSNRTIQGILIDSQVEEASGRFGGTASTAFKVTLTFAWPSKVMTAANPISGPANSTNLALLGESTAPVPITVIGLAWGSTFTISGNGISRSITIDPWVANARENVPAPNTASALVISPSNGSIVTMSFQPAMLGVRAGSRWPVYEPEMGPSPTITGTFTSISFRPAFYI